MFGFIVNVQPSRNNNCECHETETHIQHTQRTYIQGNSGHYQNQGYTVNQSSYQQPNFQQQNYQQPVQPKYTSEKSISLTGLLMTLIVCLVGYLIANSIFSIGETSGKNQQLERENEFRKGQSTRDAFYIPQD